MPATSHSQPEILPGTRLTTPIDSLCMMLMTTEEFARAMRFEQPTGSFYKSLRQFGIRPVPGRSGVYDPVHVRARLDRAAAGALQDGPAANIDMSPAAIALQRRRARRGQV